MYQVSETYNPYRAARQVQIETELRIVDEAAAGNATVTADGAAACSAVSTFAADGLTSFGAAFMTLEQNYLRCDKTYTIMPDDYNAGVWGADIGDTITINIVFSAPVSSMGLTLFFDSDGEQWPDGCYAYFTDANPPAVLPGDGLAVDPTAYSVEPERGFAVIMFDTAKTYDAITLELAPPLNRRVRLAGIAFGIVESYTNANIKTWSYKQEADICAASIPAATQSVSVLLDNGQFKLTDPALLPCIHPGLRMKTAVIVDGERVPLKDTLLESIKDDGDGVTATISSTDNVYLLDNVGFRSSGSASASMWENAGAFISAVMAQTAGLYGATSAGIPYTIPAEKAALAFNPGRKANLVRAWLPDIAQALGLHVYQTRAGAIAFVDVSAADGDNPETVDAISKSNATKITQEIANRVNAVEIQSNVSTGDADFPDEVYSYCAEITNRYTGETESKETISNALISDAIGKNAALWLLNQKNRWLTYSADWRGNPALDLFDAVTIDGKTAIVTGLSFDFNGYFKGTIKAACSLKTTMTGVNTRTYREVTWQT